MNPAAARRWQDRNISQRNPKFQSKRMKNSPAIQEDENRMSLGGFIQIGEERTTTRAKARQRPEKPAGKGAPLPPVQPVAERFPAMEKREVVLTLFAPGAKTVRVAGNFNGWNPEATSLKNTEDGHWTARLMLRSGQYEYRFIVDGQWQEDPGAEERVANPFGGFNSMLTVPLPARAGICV